MAKENKWTVFLYKLAMDIATSNFYADVYAVSYFSECNWINKMEIRFIHQISSRSFSFANFVYHKVYVERWWILKHNKSCSAT